MKHAPLLLALIATQAQAQIIYTDVIPDTTYNASNDSCSLDVDNDGNIDFLIVQRTLAAPCPGNRAGCNPNITRPRSSVKVTPLGSNAVADSASFAAQLPAWQSIDLSSTWNNASAQVLMAQGTPTCFQTTPFQWGCAAGTFTGAWSGGASVASTMFLALRFDSAGSTFHGWARLSIPTNGTSFTLKDYAYNSVPGDGILAGDTGSISTGITSHALRGMQVAPNPFSSVLTIALPTGTTGSMGCRVLSLQGQAVVTRTVAATPGQSPGQASGPSAITLDLASLAPGTYLLEMEVDGERIVRKVMKL